MKDLNLPQQAPDTKYWKDLHTITILFGTQGAEVTILFFLVHAAFIIFKNNITTTSNMLKMYISNGIKWFEKIHMAL